jgi:hypothetical protein
MFPADQQLLADPRFPSHYQFIHIDAGPPNPIRAGIYIRRIDGKLGIARSAGQVTVPAYLAAVSDAISVRLVDGEAQLVIAPHGSARFSAIPLDAGSWKVALAGSGASQLKVHGAPASGACDSCVLADANGSAELTVENTSDQPAVLASIQISRQSSRQ